MRRAALVVLCAGVAAVACSSSKSAPPLPAAGANDPAGQVIEVAGDVTAIRAAEGSAPRRLTANADVFADDTVATGPAARVVIRLTHNEVAWSLEENRKRRVDASAAWKAPRGSSAAVAELDVEEGDRTAAAGRHTEREAAETMPAPAPAMAEEPVPPAAPAPGGAPPPPPPDPGERAAVKKKAKGGLGSLGTIGHGSGSGTGSGYGSGGGSSRGGGGNASSASLTVGKPEVKGALSADIVHRVLARGKGQFRFCYEQALAVDPTLAGTVTISFMVSAEGSVNSAVVSDSSLGNAKVGACLASAVKRLTFPEGKQITGVVVPIVMKPQ